MRAVPIVVLTNNISRIYELYQKFEVKNGYVQELFDRAENEEKEIEENSLNKPEEYYELIIENGFLIYTLVNVYLENIKGE